jgi:hypothetical protein
MSVSTALATSITNCAKSCASRRCPKRRRYPKHRRCPNRLHYPNFRRCPNRHCASRYANQFRHYPNLAANDPNRHCPTKRVPLSHRLPMDRSPSRTNWKRHP